MMKKAFFLLLITMVSISLWSQTEEVAEQRVVAVQINAEIGCHFRQAVEEHTGYEKHDFIPAGFCADLGLGVRTTRWIYVGVGVGAHSEYALKEILTTIPDGRHIPFSTYRWVMPVYADVRLFIPSKLNMNPFVEGSAGYYWGLTGNKTTDGVEETFMPQNGLFAQAGVGVDFRRFMVSIGYQYFEKAEWGQPHYAYAKVGLRLGRNVNCDKKSK